VPFFVVLPSPTIDLSVRDGIRRIPIEQRGADEVATITGGTADGRIETVRVVAGRGEAEGAVRYRKPHTPSLPRPLSFFFLFLRSPPPQALVL
jgi:hypothetical protein